MLCRRHYVWLVVFLFGCVLHTSESINLNLNVSNVDIAILYDLYVATDGPNWDCCQPSSSIVWNFTDVFLNNPCADNWQGISCSNSSVYGYYISALDLHNLHLVGTVPNSLSGLNQLTYVSLGQNHLSGTIPVTLGQEPFNIQYLDMHDNYFSGVLQDSLGNLTKLTDLDLSQNYLTGSIPNTFAKLTALEILKLDSNKLNGSISNLMELKRLQQLYLDYNIFSSTLPPEIGVLTALMIVDMSGNMLTGSIPMEIGDLVQLQYLSIYNNAVSGSLPDSLGDLVSLVWLDADDNFISGSISSSFCTMTSLSTFTITNNRLSRTLPNNIGNLVALEILDVDGNMITGSLPMSLGNLTALTSLYLSSNLLTASIPDTVGRLSGLVDWGLNDNRLSGSLPSSLGDLVNLESMYLYSNTLTGPVPSSIVNCSVLSDIELYNNSLSSSLPSGLFSMSNIVYLYLANNILSGSIDDALGHLIKLEFIDLSHNQFVGTVPTTMSLCIYLLEIKLNGNKLSGGINGIINASTQLSLSNIQFNSNAFSGSIPSDIFQLPGLITFVASDNCFHGLLPSAICSVSPLASLIMNGLSSAEACRYDVFPSAISLPVSYVLRKAVHGSVPSCVYALPALHTLQLSGNEFNGKLPGSEHLGDALTSFDISHNYLTGDIGPGWQSRSWTSLHLSFNRLSGTLLANMTLAQNTSLSLENNKLSGRIPNNLVNLEDVSLLTANIFSCNLNGDDLPKHDKARHRYTCGSSTFDIPYYVWMGIVTSVLVPFTMMSCLKSKLYVRIHRRLDNYLEIAAANVTVNFNLFSVIFSKFSIYSTLFSVVLMFPLYCLLHIWWSTYTYKYAYLASAAFVAGSIPFGLELFCWVLFLCGLIFILYYSIRGGADCKQDGGKDERMKSNDAVVSHSNFHIYAVYCLYILFNLVVVSVVNAGYVYVAIYGDNSLLLTEQICLSIFKFGWNNVCSQFLLAWLVEYFMYQPGSVLVFEFSNLQIAVSFLNNIFIPLVVVLLVSPNCFYNFFVAAPVVESTYTTETCLISGITSGSCFFVYSVDDTSTYNPPFSYSYECSFSLVTYYSPIFVSLCIISSFVVPVLKYCVVQMAGYVSEGSMCAVLLKRVTPAILQLCYRDSSASLVGPADVNRIMLTSLNRHIILISTNFGLLVTFGIVFPPLAFAFALTLLVIMFVYRLELGVFCDVLSTKSDHHYVTAIEAAFGRIHYYDVLNNLIWMVVVMACLFYAMFLFDTLGLAVGFRNAYWVLIVVPLLPFALRMMCAALWWWGSAGTADTLALFSGSATTERRSHPMHERSTSVEMLNFSSGNPITQMT